MKIDYQIKYLDDLAEKPANQQHLAWDMVEAVRAGRDALGYRKSMPMEATEDGGRFCPRCQQDIAGYFASYCEQCGQALESLPEKGNCHE